MKPLLLICGPTACHKSETALRLGERWGGEILSIDSAAVYRGMDIGSAKPDPAERRRVPHHLIDIVEPDDTGFSVAAFQQAADEALEAARSSGDKNREDTASRQAEAAHEAHGQAVNTQWGQCRGQYSQGSGSRV